VLLEKGKVIRDLREKDAMLQELEPYCGIRKNGQLV
jgi:hypothetical protein